MKNWLTVTWLSRLFGGSTPEPVQPRSASGASGQATARSAQIAGTPDFALWTDPEIPVPPSEWDRRLHAYARKCASQLKEANVPLFRSEWPNSGNGTYVRAFWLVAVDVEEARRSWQQNILLGRPTVRDKGYPPSIAKGDHNGFFIGPALLLTGSGLLCTATTFGLLTRAGGLADGRMDITFKDIGVNLRQLQSLDWGWRNSGRWSQYPQDNLKEGAIQLTSMSIRFNGRWNHGTNQNTDGKGTSSALNRFVRSRGSTAWPQNFASFDYD